jgi:hypothetical protein
MVAEDFVQEVLHDMDILENTISDLLLSVVVIPELVFGGKLEKDRVGRIFILQC